MAVGSDTIDGPDVEFLLERVGIHLDAESLQRIIRSELLRNTEQYAMCNDRFSFDMFVGVACAILSEARARADEAPRTAIARLSRLLPLDPESQYKQVQRAENGGREGGREGGRDRRERASERGRSG